MGEVEYGEIAVEAETGLLDISEGLQDFTAKTTGNNLVTGSVPIPVAGYIYDMGLGLNKNKYILTLNNDGTVSFRIHSRADVE